MEKPDRIGRTPHEDTGIAERREPSMKPGILGAAIVLSALLFGGGALAATQANVSAVFTSEERRAIKEYYTKDIIDQAWESEGKGHGKKKGLPPGLAKKAKLPPGLRKQLQRNGTLPPGLEQKLEPLPEPLDVRLRRLPSEYERVVIGQDVVILDRTTQKILDIIRDVAILSRDITR
jgi:hypothetical protein